MKRRRVLLAGLGSIGLRHLRLLLEREDVSVEAVESDEQARARFRQQYNDVRVYPGLTDGLAKAPDVVWLATPTHLHVSQAVAAMEAGCEVFCEKPASDSLAGAEEMRAAAERSKRVVNIGFYLHFWKGAQRMKELITSGALGRIVHAHARVGSYITLVNSASRYQERSPGSLVLDYSHQPDLLYWLLGEAPSTVFSSARTARGLERVSTPNLIDIHCDYSSGMLSHIHLNYIQMPEKHQYEITGEDGWVTADFRTGILEWGDRRSAVCRTESVAQDRDDIFRAEHQAFFEALEGRRAAETTPADGMVSAAICEAALQSWQSAALVAVPAYLAGNATLQA